MAIIIECLLIYLLLAVATDALQFAPYVPRRSTCPPTPLVRSANGISAEEAAYIAQRKPKADTALAQWLLKTDAGFETSKLPTVALATSGGGYRSMLTGAGVIQGFDSRDSNTGTSGLLQGLTYQSGLSGGAWLLSSLAGNDYPTVSSLRNSLWEQTLEEDLLQGPILTNSQVRIPIEDEIASKDLAGYHSTLVDPYGRSLSYQLLFGPSGGVTKTMSGISAESNYTSHNVPFPIITALGVDTFDGERMAHSIL